MVVLFQTGKWILLTAAIHCVFWNIYFLKFAINKMLSAYNDPFFFSKRYVLIDKG